jgi:hypothetical protein
MAHTLTTASRARSFFTFHGKVLKVTIQDSLGLVEFADAPAARSALLFDQASFLGQTISVTMDKPPAEAAKPQEVAEEEAYEDPFVRVDKPTSSDIADHNVAPAAAQPPTKTQPPPQPPHASPPDPAADSAAPASPPRAPSSAAAAAAQKASPEPKTSVPKAAPAVPKAAPAVPKAAPAASPTPTKPKAAPAATTQPTGRLGCIRAIAAEPLNRPVAALALNLAAGLLLAMC